jgi:hypothetical protein
MTLQCAIQVCIIKYFYTRFTGYPSITWPRKYFFARIITHRRKSVHLDLAGIGNSPFGQQGLGDNPFQPRIRV